jgi:hypothetical protein
LKISPTSESGEAGLTYDTITADTPLASDEGYRHLLAFISLCRRVFWDVYLVCHEKSPHNPRILIGQGYRGLVLPTLFYEGADPLTASIRLEPDPA